MIHWISDTPAGVLTLGQTCVVAVICGVTSLVYTIFLGGCYYSKNGCCKRRRSSKYLEHVDDELELDEVNSGSEGAE